MVRRVLRRLRERANYLDGADFYTAPDGLVIRDGVIAIKQPDWTSPALFTHPCLEGVSAGLENVRIQDKRLILRDDSGKEIVIIGTELTPAPAQHELEWDGVIRTPEDRRVDRQSLVRETF